MSYDHEWNEDYWMTRPVTVTKRLITIGAVIHGNCVVAGGLPRQHGPSTHCQGLGCAGIAFVKWRTYYSLNGEEKAAEYLKDLLTSLGPAFVKIGQAVSSRPDVVPPVYIRQLEFLQVLPPCPLPTIA